jgi:UDP-apiose/xylose synthase
MKIALLGAGGFIGSNIVDNLLSCSTHTVTGVDTAPEKLDEVLAPLSAEQRARWQFHQADIRSSMALVRDIIGESDVVVDLIAHANPSMYVSRPIDVFELNFMQNLEVARLCMAQKKWLIQYSSAEVYGKARSATPYTEDGSDSVFGPVSKQRWIYAVAKQLLERVLYAHGEAGDLAYTIVRPFNFLGRRIDYLVPAGAIGGPRVFPHFMSALLSGGPIRLVDGGTARRAFLHIDDATAAFRAILDQPARAQNTIFNVGNPENELTMRELAQLMTDLFEELTGTPSSSAVEVMSGEAFYGEGYEDGDREPPDISRMRAIGWAPTRGLRDTVRDAMLYYLGHRTLAR